MDYLTKATGLKKEEIVKRMRRLYDERLIMFVKTPPMQIIGYGLYYWLVKLKDGTPKEKKQKLSAWFQNNDKICTGSETAGDFDCFNGCHMRVLDNLLHDVIFPLENLPEVEYVHLAPVRRVLREAMVNYV
jgi:transcription initiation factor IIE alpha subunit